MNVRHHPPAARPADHEGDRFSMERPGIGTDGASRQWRAASPLPAPHAVTRVFALPQGLHALSIGAIGAKSAAGASVSLPCIQLVSLPSAEFDPVDIFTAWNDQGAWLGVEGGVVVVRAPPGGGQVLATLYGDASIDARTLDAFSVRRLDAAGGDVPPDIGRADVPVRPIRPQLAPAFFRTGEMEVAAPELARDAAREPALGVEWSPPVEDDEIELEVLLHIEQSGDALFPGGAWCGTIGQKLQVEGFGVRCIDPSAEMQFEYKAYGPAGRETRWVSEGKLCGTRGRGIPLTGFAIRLTPDFADRYDVTYQGAFFESGVTLPVSNGESCLPALADDYLEAVLVRVSERVG